MERQWDRLDDIAARSEALGGFPDAANEGAHLCQSVADPRVGELFREHREERVPPTPSRGARPPQRERESQRPDVGLIAVVGDPRDIAQLLPRTPMGGR